jgi:hypothetical protein
MNSSQTKCLIALLAALLLALAAVFFGLTRKVAGLAAIGTVVYIVCLWLVYRTDEARHTKHDAGSVEQIRIALCDVPDILVIQPIWTRFFYLIALATPASFYSFFIAYQYSDVGLLALVVLCFGMLFLWFAASAFSLALTVLRGGVFMQIDSSGITHVSAGFLPWDCLQNYAIQRTIYENSRFEKNEQITLNLTLKAEHFVVHYPSLPIRWTNAIFLKYNKDLFQIQIGLGTMNCHPDRIAAAISRHFGEDLIAFHNIETKVSNELL